MKDVGMTTKAITIGKRDYQFPASGTTRKDNGISAIQYNPRSFAHWPIYDGPVLTVAIDLSTLWESGTTPEHSRKESWKIAKANEQTCKALFKECYQRYAETHGIESPKCWPETIQGADDIALDIHMRCSNPISLVKFLSEMQLPNGEPLITHAERHELFRAFEPTWQERQKANPPQNLAARR